MMQCSFLYLHKQIYIILAGNIYLYVCGASFSQRILPFISHLCFLPPASGDGFFGFAVASVLDIYNTTRNIYSKSVFFGVFFISLFFCDFLQVFTTTQFNTYIHIIFTQEFTIQYNMQYV